METKKEPKSKKIYPAMIAVMRDIESIAKGKTNQAQGFKFRGIDDVYNSIHNVMAKNGVFSIPQVLEERTEERKTQRGGNLIYRILKIKYTFYAEDGSNVESIVIGEGMDSGDKASNKAMSIADKYCLLQAFKIPTEDMAEPDAQTHPQSEPDKSAAIKILLSEFAKLKEPTPEMKAYIAGADKLTYAQIGIATKKIKKIISEVK